METVILSSKPTNQFPNNHGGDFRNVINHPLNVQYKPGRQFKVALAELFYVPGSWPNVRTGANYVDIKVEGYPINELVLQTVYVDHWDVLNDAHYLKYSSHTTESISWDTKPRAYFLGPGAEFVRFVRYIPNQSPHLKPKERFYKVYDSVTTVP